MFISFQGGRGKFPYLPQRKARNFRIFRPFRGENFHIQQDLAGVAFLLTFPEPDLAIDAVTKGQAPENRCRNFFRDSVTRIS